MALVSIRLTPMGEGTSVGEYIARAEKVLSEDGRVKYRIESTSTTLEGKLDDCLAVARKMHEEVFTAGAARVETEIFIDDRRDKQTTLEYEVRSVEKKLNAVRSS